MKKVTSQKANNIKIHFNPLIWLGIALIILTHFSCQKDKMEGDIINDSRLIENLYTNSSDTLTIDTQKLILETYLYRNFTPGVPYYERNSRLFASVYLVNIDSTLITQNFTVTKLYVINNNQAWNSKPEFRSESYLRDFMAYFISKNGPEWETGIRVDVVLSITDLTSNKEKFLIARNQIIHRVE